jgi:glucose/arabinose dehydrogenase
MPFATFPPRSTPTGVAVLPDGRVLVALFTAAFVEGGVVEVAPDGTVRDILTGVRNPQDLLLLPDGSVLLTAHTEGRLLRLVPS